MRSHQESANKKLRTAHGVFHQWPNSSPSSSMVFFKLFSGSQRIFLHNLALIEYFTVLLYSRACLCAKVHLTRQVTCRPIFPRGGCIDKPHIRCYFGATCIRISISDMSSNNHTMHYKSYRIHLTWLAIQAEAGHYYEALNCEDISWIDNLSW